MAMTAPAAQTRFVVLRGERAVSDDTGRLLMFQVSGLVALFVEQLDALVAEPVFALSRTSEQITDLLAHNGVEGEEAADRVVDFEAQTISPQDAARWAIELANRIAASTQS